MAISQICQYEVREEIDKMQNDGISRNEASKQLAKFFSGMANLQTEWEMNRR